MSEYFIFNERQFVVETVTPPPAGKNFYQLLPAPNPRARVHPDNPLNQDPATTLVSAPDIVVLDEGSGQVTLDREKQEYLIKLNYNMRMNNVAGLLGDKKAFTNRTGFPVDPGDPRRQNWIMLEDLTAPLFPKFDKVRSCSFAVHAGTDDGQYITLDAFDGNKPFPSLETINPQTHPYMYFQAIIIYSDGVTAPFPNGASAWGFANVVWLPLVSQNKIVIPVSMARKVSAWMPPPYGE